MYICFQFVLFSNSNSMFWSGFVINKTLCTKSIVEQLLEMAHSPQIRNNKMFEATLHNVYELCATYERENNGSYDDDGGDNVNIWKPHFYNKIGKILLMFDFYCIVWLHNIMGHYLMGFVDGV